MKNWKEDVAKLRSSGNFDATMSALNNLLSENPDDAEVLFQIAWTHDVLGKETDAAPFYERAIALRTLSDQDLVMAFLGLGSTYRNLAEYDKSAQVFERGIKKFPEHAALKIFYAMTLYNLKNHSGAMEILLKELSASSSDETIKTYHKAIAFYADKLDQTFK